MTNVVVKYPPYTESENEIIKKYYPIGGIKEVLKFLEGHPKCSINYQAKKLGVRAPVDIRENQANIDDFLNIKNEKIAYLLGFLWGDGYVNLNQTKNKKTYSVIFCIGERDGKSLIEQGLFDERWKIVFRKGALNRSSQNQVVISIHHKKLVLFLAENDFVIKSQTSPCKILGKIPESLHYHFFRGWYDADGFSRSSITDIYGSHEQDWTALKVLSKKLNISFKITQRTNSKGKSSNFTWNQLFGRIFLSYIYQDHIFSLKRKFDRYLEIVLISFAFWNFKRQKNMGIKFYQNKTKESHYLVTINYRKEYRKFATIEEAQNFYDDYMYQKEKNILRLYSPERYKNDPNYHLYLEAKKIYDLHSHKIEEIRLREEGFHIK